MSHFIILLFLISKTVFAADNDSTEIFGEAETKSGEEVSALMIVPQEEETQQPISPEQIKVTPEEPTPKEKPLPDIKNAENIKKIEQWSPQDPKPFSISPQEEQDEIENTLYEGGDRIYDVQSYPIKDIKTITEPNIDPTISTYPEY